MSVSSLGSVSTSGGPGRLLIPDLQTGETVKADKDWTRLSGELSIDVSVVAGFMFVSDDFSNPSFPFSFYLGSQRPPTPPEKCFPSFLQKGKC